MKRARREDRAWWKTVFLRLRKIADTCMNMSTYSLVVLMVLVIFINVTHSTKLINIKDTSMSVLRSNSIPRPGNETKGTYTEWTPWSACKNCWQYRVKMCVSPRCKDSRLYEERPCDRKRCHRQRHMKSIDKRLHIFKERMGTEINPKKLKAQVWSKWSRWKECSRDCKTERYKVCKNPGKCRLNKKSETAYCYVENSVCKEFVLQLLNSMDMNQSFGEKYHYSYQTTKKPVRYSKNYKPSTIKCGRPRRGKALKILGGTDAKRNKWPWHVAILNIYSEVFCSGTLIAPRWVLTASHCLRDYLKVRLNEYDLSHMSMRKREMVVHGIAHPSFDQNTVDNDIALLWLPESARLPYACLPNYKPLPNKKCSIMGWGKIRNSDIVGSTILQEAEIPIVSNFTCKSAYRRYHITENMFCAGLSTGKVDTCAGDSGGGLMCRTRRGTSTKRWAYTVQGITSFGDGCGYKDKYGIYTNVVNYIDWIYRTMSNFNGKRFV